MRNLSYAWLDVFADRPFAGNALCVILNGTGLTDDVMQAIARETNLSETTFVLPPTQAGATYRNRIFTPGGELAFAGHPTLGTAAALALAGQIAGPHAVQETKSGLTPLTLEYTGTELDRVVMEAPQPALVSTPDPDQIAAALNLAPHEVTPGGLRPAVIKAGVAHLIIPVASPEVLGRIQPDTQAVLNLSRSLGCIGFYPFALLPEGSGAYARARLFAPLYGIAEDPATGSAAAPLGAYLQANGRMPRGKNAFWYEQGVEMGRPSRLWVEVTGESNALRVRVGGQVRQLGRGEFHL